MEGNPSFAMEGNTNFATEGNGNTNFSTEGNTNFAMKGDPCFAMEGDPCFAIKGNPTFSRDGNPKFNMEEGNTNFSIDENPNFSVDDSVKALAQKSDLIYASKRESLRDEIDRLREFLLQMSKDRDLLHKQEQAAHILCKRKLEWTEKKLQETQVCLNETQNEAASLLESKHLEMEAMQRERDEALKKAEMMNEELCFLRKYGDHLEEQFSGLIGKLHKCYAELQSQTEDMVRTYERSDEEWLPVKKTVTRFGSCLQEFQKTTSQLSMEKDHYLYLNGEGQTTVINDEIGMTGEVLACEVKLKNDESPLMSCECTNFPGYRNGDESCSTSGDRCASVEDNLTRSTFPMMHAYNAEEKMRNSTSFTELNCRYRNGEENCSTSSDRYANAEDNLTHSTLPMMHDYNAEEKMRNSTSFTELNCRYRNGEEKCSTSSDRYASAEDNLTRSTLPMMHDYNAEEKMRNSTSFTDLNCRYRNGEEKCSTSSDRYASAEDNLMPSTFPMTHDYNAEEKMRNSTSFTELNCRYGNGEEKCSTSSDRYASAEDILTPSTFPMMHDYNAEEKMRNSTSFTELNCRYRNGEEKCSTSSDRYASAEDSLTPSTFPMMHDYNAEEKMRNSTSFTELNCRHRNGEEKCSTSSDRYASAEDNLTRSTLPMMHDYNAEEKMRNSTSFTELNYRYRNGEEKCSTSSDRYANAEDKMKMKTGLNGRFTCSDKSVVRNTLQNISVVRNTLSKIIDIVAEETEGNIQNNMLSPTSDHIAEENTTNTMQSVISDHIAEEKQTYTMSDLIAEDKLRNTMLPVMPQCTAEDKNDTLLAISDRVLEDNELVSAMSDHMLEEKPLVFDNKFESYEDFVNMGIDMESDSGIWCPTKMKKLEQAIMDAHRRYMVLCKGESERMEGTQSAHHAMYEVDEDYLQEARECFEDGYTSDSSSDIVSEFLEKIFSKDGNLMSRRSRYDDHFLANMLKDEDDMFDMLF